MKKLFKKLIGDKKFYKMILVIAIPIMIQNGITNFVGMLDNIMVGRIGTEQMSGVAIINQLLFVFNICIFGAISGAGIFGAQFFGQKNHEGVRNTFRFKMVMCGVIVAVGYLVFIGCGRDLINLYLHGKSNSGDIELTLDYAQKYLKIMIIELVPFTFVQIYASTLRETGQTMLPMKAGIVAVLVNLMLNYILIYGMFGIPALGVEGAAIATVFSRFVECGIVVIWTHIHKERNLFIDGVYKHFYIPMNLTKKILSKGTPLLVNEALWASGMAILTQAYSIRGLAVVAGFNISSTIFNVFNIVFIAMGNAVAIVVGQLLGAGKMQEAKETAGKMIFFSVCSCVFIGAIMLLCSGFFPQIYNTTEEVKYLAMWFIRIAAILMPLQAFLQATYFTLRSGGKTIVTFLFDSVYIWVVIIPLAFFLTRLTNMNILMIYFICQFVDIIKCMIGFVLVKKGAWMQNIVEK